jgi:DNA (cytosine-5)-methyltransferase 1
MSSTPKQDDAITTGAAGGSAPSCGSKPLTFGSLFAGIGGFDLGLERAGMRCEWQVEIDPYARAVLAKHWPDVRRHEDVRTFPPPEGEWGVDVICGGFPCQDISVAGKGAGLAGARSGLWYEYARIIGELRPRYVIVENVAALLARGMGTVLGDLSTLGYDAEWHVIPASAVGAPHRRERIWIVAHAVSERYAVRGDREAMQAGVACGRGNAGRSQCDCGTRCPKSPGEGACLAANANSYGASHWRQDERVGWKLSPFAGAFAGRGRLASEEGSQWETEPDVGRVADGISSRLDRLRGLGNSVVPQVVEIIGRAIVTGARA